MKLPFGDANSMNRLACLFVLVPTWVSGCAPAVPAAPVGRLHVLAVGDSVQWGGVKGEIVKCAVVPNGKTVIVEIQTKPAPVKAGKTGGKHGE